jgi:hypothetical protein
VPSPRLYRPQISEELEGIVLRALSRKPSQRFESAAQMLDALGMLMVREGHRVTNNDLAAFLQAMGPEGSEAPIARVRSVPETLVVVAGEAVAADPARPQAEVDALVEGWCDDLVGAGAQIWEREHGAFLAVWIVDEDLSKTAPHVVGALRELRDVARGAGCRLSVGIAPGKARIFEDTRRPGRAWELAGPFHLARWLMNLSGERDALLVSRLVADEVPKAAPRPLGHLELEEGRRVEVHQIG